MEYKVVLEIELSADCPLEAAKLAKEWCNDSDLQFYVQGSDNVTYSVDLSEEDEDKKLAIYERALLGIDSALKSAEGKASEDWILD